MIFMIVETVRLDTFAGIFAAMTASLKCRPVATRRDQREFLNLEKRLYQDDANWVPPIWMTRKQLVGFKPHPFYDDAEGQTFLVQRDDRVVGRVLAIVNHAHNRTHQESRGFFGFFECEDDQAASNLLLQTACNWLRERGMTDARGPVHPSLNYEVGLLVEGFDTPPTFLMPYNHAYYARLIEGFGFQKTQDALSFEASFELLGRLDPKMSRIVEQSRERFRVSTRPVDPKNFDADIQVFLKIYNESLQRTWGYVPMSQAETVEQGHGLKHLLIPELTSIAEIDGRPVGAGFGLLDYNPLIKKIGGKLFPFGFLRLLAGRKHIRRVRMVSANVLPEYQKWGLGLVTLQRMVPAGVDFGIREAEFSWVLESNALSKNTIIRGGATQSKTHRIYDLSLTADLDASTSNQVESPPPSAPDRSTR
ncbi:MAG: N-acetyltransferase [Planctomycetota bacterium]